MMFKKMFKCRTLLKNERYSLVIAQNGEGYRQGVKIMPDIILLDINIPRLNGIEVYQN